MSVSIFMVDRERDEESEGDCEMRRREGKPETLACE